MIEVNQPNVFVSVNCSCECYRVAVRGEAQIIWMLNVGLFGSRDQVDQTACSIDPSQLSSFTVRPIGNRTSCGC